MICEACRAGRHDHCEKGGCECSERTEANFQRDLAAYVHGQGDEGLAETIYSNLLAGNSGVVRMFTDGAGQPAVKLLIQQVLQAHKAIKN